MPHGSFWPGATWPLGATFVCQGATWPFCAAFVWKDASGLFCTTSEKMALGFSVPDPAIQCHVAT